MEILDALKVVDVWEINKTYSKESDYVELSGTYGNWIFILVKWNFKLKDEIVYWGYARSIKTDCEFKLPPEVVESIFNKHVDNKLR